MGPRLRDGRSDRLNDDTERRQFIQAHTGVAPVPSLPRIRLHMVSDADRLWRMTAADREEAGVALPFWAFPWVGGQAVARWLLDNPDEVRGRRIVDIGAGSGLVGIAARLAGAAGTLCIDVDPLAVAAIALNAALNGVAIAIDNKDVLDDPPPPVDLVLVGDLFYERPLAQRLIVWLDRCLAGGARVLIGDPGRRYLPAARLRLLASYDILASADLEDRPVKPTAVYSLERA